MATWTDLKPQEQADFLREIDCTFTPTGFKLGGNERPDEAVEHYVAVIRGISDAELDHRIAVFEDSIRDCHTAKLAAIFQGTLDLLLAEKEVRA